MSDIFGIPYADVDAAPTRTDADPTDDPSPFKGLAIAALLSLPIDLLIIGLIVMWIKS